MTMGVLAGTKIFFSPSLYFNVSVRPSTVAPTCSTFAFVIMLCGRRSHGYVRSFQGCQVHSDDIGRKLHGKRKRLIGQAIPLPGHDRTNGGLLGWNCN